MPQKTLIYGFHALVNQLEGSLNNLEKIYFVKSRQDKRMQRMMTLAKERGIVLEVATAGELNKLTHQENHQGVVGVLFNIKTYVEADIEGLLGAIDNKTLVLVLDGIQDPHNLGACLRSADGAGVSFVIAPKDNACSLTPVVKKVASGAAESVPFIQVTNLARTLRALKEKGIWLVGLDDKASNSLYATDFNMPCALVLGSEGSGVRRLTKKHCDFLAHIPMQGAVSSLNVSVATGICLFEALRQKN